MSWNVLWMNCSEDPAAPMTACTAATECLLPSAGTVCEEKHPYHVNVERKEEEVLRRRKRKLAIGVQDFRFLRERKAYYVDKTQMAAEFLDSWYQVTLLTRPRRFGKTMNMSMLAEFLDCTKDSAEIFAGTKISRSEWMPEMNQHPVVFLSFLNVKADSASMMTAQLGGALWGEYERYSEVINNSDLPESQKDSFNHIYNSLRSRMMMWRAERVLLIPLLCCVRF